MEELERTKIEALYREMYGKLLAYARSMLPNEVLAEEAVQETFYLACIQPEQLRTCESEAMWLVQTLQSFVLERQRDLADANMLLQEHQRAESRVLSDVAVPLEQLYGDISETEDFQLLKEYAVMGLSHQQMAEKRGISIQACRKRVQRAKEHLRRLMQENDS